MDIRISALAIQHLKEALSNIYWYKSDLKSFLVTCINDKSVVYNANWDLYKRQIISDIIDDLMSNQNKHLGDIRRIRIQADTSNHLR